MLSTKVGWWYLDRPENWTPPPELVDFLAAGPPPVCVGFGSVADRNPSRLTRIVLDGLARSGQRAVLLTGWGGLDATDIPETVFQTDSIPHDWLFPRMAAVVTHGGSGTVGAALRAGIPAVVVPCWNDQPFWAKRLHEMGVSPRPIPKRRLSPKRLAAAIDAAVHDQQIRERAAEVARQIASEDGVARAMEAFEEYVRRRRG